MKSKKKTINILFIIIVILAIAFYSYNISQNKGSIKIENNQKSKIIDSSTLEKGVTKFIDVEYKTTDKKNRDYITKGKEALISKDDPGTINLSTVHSFTTLNDGTVLNVKSDKANYFKKTKNIKYYQNVTIMNKQTIISSEIANFFANKNLIRLEKNVVFKDPKNIIKADVAELDTVSNNIQIFMNKKKDKVYGRRQQK